MVRLCFKVLTGLHLVILDAGLACAFQNACPTSDGKLVCKLHRALCPSISRKDQP